MWDGLFFVHQPSSLKSIREDELTHSLVVHLLELELDHGMVQSSPSFCEIIFLSLRWVYKCKDNRNLPFIFLHSQMLYSFLLHVQFKSSERSSFVFIEVELQINTVYLSDNWQIILRMYKVRPPVKNTILEMTQTSCVVLVCLVAVEIVYLFIYLLPFWVQWLVLWEKFIFLVCQITFWNINRAEHEQELKPFAPNKYILNWKFDFGWFLWFLTMDCICTAKNFAH